MNIDSTFETLPFAVAQSLNRLDEMIPKFAAEGKQSPTCLGRGVHFHISIQNAPTKINLDYTLDWKDDHSFKPCYVQVCIFERTDQGDTSTTEDIVRKVSQACLPLFKARGFKAEYCDCMWRQFAICANRDIAVC